MKRSRSVSFSIFSSGWPVCLSRIRLSRSLIFAELLGVDHDVFGRAFHAGHRLVDEDAGIGQGVALPLGAGGQQHGRHRGRLADAVGGHVAGDELHRVVDRQPGGDAAARRVDVKVDRGLGVFGLEEEQLGDDRGWPRRR